MQIREISYERNGFKAVAILNPTDDVREASTLLKEFVYKGCEAVPDLSIRTEVSAPEVVSTKKKAPTKKAKKPVEEERTYTLEEVQGALKALVQAKGSRDIPNQILKDIGGAEKLADVDASKYSAVMKEVAKCLK